MLRSLTRRRMAPAAIAAVAALILTGCGSDDKDDPKADDTSSAEATPSGSATDGSGDGTDGETKYDACKVASGGTSADVKKVAGDFGKVDAKPEFENGLKTDKIERTVLDKGDKATSKKGQTLNVIITAYNATNGKKVSSEKAQVIVGDVTLPNALDAGFDCVPVGSRVVTTFPATEIYGDSGNAELSIESEDSLVIVTDVVSVEQPRKVATWTDAPKVTLKKGIPSFKLVGKPRTKLLLDVITKGKGGLVGPGDTVSVKYHGVSWNTKKVFDENFSAGKQPAEFAVTGVVKGFGAALVGQKAGAKLLVTMPPTDAYGAGAINDNDLVGQTLVFYIEIISTKPPA